MNPIFIDKLEKLCDVPESVFHSHDLLNLYTDTLRSLLSKLLSPQSISRVLLSIDNLKTAFMTLKKEIEQKRRVENKIFALDTSELISSSSPVYNWYYCLRSIFSNPKSLDFVVPPWFLIETVGAFIRRVEKRPHSNYEAKVLNEITKQEDIKKYFDQFDIDWEASYIHLRPNQWEQPDLSLKFIESLKSICKRNRSVFVAIRLNRLFKMGVMRTPESMNLIKSFNQYGEFAGNVNNNNEMYLEFRKDLYNTRKYLVYHYNKTPEQIQNNSSIDSISVGFLDWMLQKMKSIDKKLFLLSRDSLYKTANAWFENDKLSVSCYNTQTLYLQWMLINSSFNVRDLLYICDKAIDELGEINDILSKTVVLAKSYKLEAIQKIIYWFSKRRILKKIEHDIVRAALLIARSQGMEQDEMNIQGYVQSILCQTDDLDDKVMSYQKISEMIIESVDKLENKFGDKIIPLFDEVDKWSKQINRATISYQKAKIVAHSP